MKQLLLDLDRRYHFVRLELAKPDAAGHVWRWSLTLDREEAKICDVEMTATGCVVSWVET